MLGGNDVNTSLTYAIIKNKINENERLEKKVCRISYILSSLEFFILFSCVTMETRHMAQCAYGGQRTVGALCPLSHVGPMVWLQSSGLMTGVLPTKLPHQLTFFTMK